MKYITLILSFFIFQSSFCEQTYLSYEDFKDHFFKSSYLEYLPLDYEKKSLDDMEKWFNKWLSYWNTHNPDKLVSHAKLKQSSEFKHINYFLRRYKSRISNELKKDYLSFLEFEKLVEKHQNLILSQRPVYVMDKLKAFKDSYNRNQKNIKFQIPENLFELSIPKKEFLQKIINPLKRKLKKETPSFDEFERLFLEKFHQVIFRFPDSKVNLSNKESLHKYMSSFMIDDLKILSFDPNEMYQKQVEIYDHLFHLMHHHYQKVYEILVRKYFEILEIDAPSFKAKLKIYLYDYQEKTDDPRLNESIHVYLKNMDYNITTNQVLYEDRHAFYKETDLRRLIDYSDRRVLEKKAVRHFITKRVILRERIKEVIFDKIKKLSSKDRKEIKTFVNLRKNYQSKLYWLKKEYEQTNRSFEEYTEAFSKLQSHFFPLFEKASFRLIQIIDFKRLLIEVCNEHRDKEAYFYFESYLRSKEFNLHFEDLLKMISKDMRIFDFVSKYFEIPQRFKSFHDPRRTKTGLLDFRPKVKR